mgnify:CR=1 FL=1
MIITSGSKFFKASLTLIKPGALYLFSNNNNLDIFLSTEPINLNFLLK